MPGSCGWSAVTSLDPLDGGPNPCARTPTWTTGERIAGVEDSRETRTGGPTGGALRSAGRGSAVLAVHVSAVPADVGRVNGDESTPLQRTTYGDAAAAGA